MTELSTAVIEHIRTLTVTQGQGAGQPFDVLPWESKFLRGALSPGVDVAALSVGRGNGKTTLTAAVAHAALCGPLAVDRGEITIVASSFEQARLTFDHVCSFIGYENLKDRNHYRLWDSAQLARLRCLAHGTQLRCLASDPRRMHGIAPVLALCDEPAQWEGAKSDKAYAALQTSMGKIEGARLIALGTRPVGSSHWFSQLLDGGADYSQSHRASADDPFDDPTTWAKANPSLAFMPTLRGVIEREAERAKANPDLIPQFEAYRLNKGVSDIAESLLLGADVWERAEGDVPRGLRYCLGLDLGTSAAQSAAAAYWPDGGRLDCFAVFPKLPGLNERGRLDGVGGLYVKMAERGELLQLGKHTSDIGGLLREVLERWGAPISITVDRWREAELREALDVVRFPQVPLVIRGQGFKDGAEDVRFMRRAVMDGDVTPAVSLLLRNAMSEARVVTDAAGNSKLAKSTEGGRRLRARDDAAAAAILAIAAGSRIVEEPNTGGMVLVS